MATQSFTNEQLCQAWVKVRKANGTRSDVVLILMGVAGKDAKDDKERAKMYNNVTQRVKQLGEHKTQPIVFPTLAAGQKGAKRTPEQMQSLQSILDQAKDEDDAPDDEGDAKDAVAAAVDAVENPES